MPARAVPILACSLAAGMLAALAWVLTARSGFADLAVFEWGAQEAFEPTQLLTERHPVSGMQFAYTPFAAALFALVEPLGALRPAPFTVLSLLALARCCVLVARAAPGLLARHSRLVAAVALFGLALATEPMVELLRLGQVGVLLAWLVLEDLLPERRWRLSGVLVGLATAIKLTPALFVVLLAVVGRWRAALVASATFALTVLVGWILLPAETRVFFGGLGADAERFGHNEFVSNQSLNGLALRLLGPDAPSAVHLVGAALACVACLALARVWWRSDTSEGRLGAIGIVGLGTLFASPVSWTHHWVIALPLLVALWVRGGRWVRGLVVASYLVICSRIVWRVPHDNGREFDHTPLEALGASSYLIVGAALLAGAWFARPRIASAKMIWLGTQRMAKLGR